MSWSRLSITFTRKHPHITLKIGICWFNFIFLCMEYSWPCWSRCHIILYHVITSHMDRSSSKERSSAMKHWFEVNLKLLHLLALDGAMKRTVCFYLRRRVCSLVISRWSPMRKEGFRSTLWTDFASRNHHVPWEINCGCGVLLWDQEQTRNFYGLIASKMLVSKPTQNK